MVIFVMRFKDIPKSARMYIIYHVLIAPTLISWYLLPLYLMMTGYNPLEVGVLFSVTNALSIVLVYIVGKFFDRVPIKYGLVTVEITNSTAYFFYFLSSGAMSGLFLLLGRIAEEASFIFYPLYPAYERIIYPKPNRTEILNWHLRLPEFSQIVSFPIIGYLLGYVFTRPFHYRISFLLISITSVLAAWYLMKFLVVDKEREKLSRESFSFRFSPRFWKFLVIDSLMALSNSLIPELVLINYVVFKLHKTLFEITLIEVTMSISTIAATYLSDRMKRDQRFMIFLGMTLVSVSLFLISLGVNFPILVPLYGVIRFGSTVMFPYYRSWMWSFVPPKSSAQVHGALSSLRKIIGMMSPAIAGFLASVGPTFPYIASATLYAFSAAFILMFKKL